MKHDRASDTAPPGGTPALPRETNLYLMFGVTLMVVMGVASISPAFPTVMRELGISERRVGLLISFFTVPGVLFAPVVGILADRIGRKKILVPALFLFGLAGGACAIATSFRMMLFLRFLQGIGATSMGTLNVTIIGDLYTGKIRTKVLGYNISVLNVGTALYPAIGGALTMLGWRYPFMLALVALPLGVLVIFFLKNPEPSNDLSFGTYLSRVLSSIKRKQAIGLFIISVVSFLVLYGAYMTYLPILLDRSFGASSLSIGMVMFVMSISTALTSSQVGFFAGKLSERTILNGVYLFFTASMFLFPLMKSLAGFTLPTALLGIGLGVSIPCLQSLLVEMAPIKHRAAFLSVNSMVLRVGQTLGPIVMSTVLLFGGIESVFYTGALLSLSMVVVTWAMIGSKAAGNRH